MLRGWIDAIRRNHALEHATVAVLLARHGPMRLAGRASADGFLLYGALDPDEVISAANEALQRLQGGQPELAVSPLCGTNIAVAGMAAATAAIIALTVGPRRGRLPNAFIASMFAVIAAQPMGRAVQQHVTTCADLDGVAVVGVREIVGQLRKVQTSGARR